MAHLRRQRHPVVEQPLASNKDFAGSPVDVLELEIDHFPGAKTQAGEQEKDGVVAATDHRAAVTGFEHTFDFLGSQVLGHGGQPPVRHCGHRDGQVGLQFSLLKQVSKERAESRRHQLRSSDLPAAGVPQNKVRNIGSFQCLQKKRSATKALQEELTNERLVFQDRVGYKPALYAQMCFVSIENVRQR